MTVLQLGAADDESAIDLLLATGAGTRDVQLWNVPTEAREFGVLQQMGAPAGSRQHEMFIRYRNAAAVRWVAREPAARLAGLGGLRGALRESDRDREAE